MEFRKKLKNVLQAKGLQKVQNALRSNSQEVPDDNNFTASQLQPVARDSEAELRSLPSDPEADNAILKTIDPLFYTSDGFDPSLFELQKLPEDLDIEYIKKARSRVIKELTVVSKKVFQLILEKQSCYTGEIQRVREIEDELAAAIFTCSESRKDLAISKKQFTVKSLGILANYRKRQTAYKLLQNLKTVHTLQQTEERLQELLSEEDYPGAIQLLLECQQAAVTYNHFTCISQLSKTLQDTLENAEEQLDVALSKVCLYFDEKTYKKLHKAYKLLGKTHTCMDQMLMHFASAIHNTAFSIVHGFAELCKGDEQQLNLQKKQYQDLCSCLSTELFLPCLTDLSKALWKILLNYYKLLNWHANNSSLSASDEDLLDESEVNFNDEYINQKLQNGSSHVWQDIQTKTRTFLLAFDFSGFKIDEFMQVLSVIHSLKEIGAEFCSSESESLQDCIRQTSLRYFLKYHDSKLEELKVFLECEAWQMCPVRSDFDLLQLHEFRFMKGETDSPRSVARLKEERKVFEKFFESGTPFDISKEDSEENIYSDSTSKIHESSDEDDNNSDSGIKDRDEDYDRAKMPTITNTSLSILRLFGRYLHMMHLFDSIAYDVAVCMSQLFEYYFYAVFSFFTSDNGDITIESIANAQLRLALIRIRDSLKQKEIDICDADGKINLVSQTLCMKNEDNLFGLAERVVASESVVFLATQLDRLKKFAHRHIPESSWDSVAQLIDQAVIVSLELRRPIYSMVTSQAINYQSFLTHMEKVNWSVNDLMSQHSSYVDMLLRALQVFSMRMETIGDGLIIPQEAIVIIWEQVFRFCCRIFVEGFANAKKCSNGGRGLMQLDFTQFLSKLEKISPVSVKNSPDRDYVEGYVKAFYMPEGVMEEWLQKHSEYSSKQLTSLVNCALQGNKKSKQRLLTLIEELEKDKVRR